MYFEVWVTNTDNTASSTCPACKADHERKGYLVHRIVSKGIVCRWCGITPKEYYANNDK